MAYFEITQMGAHAHVTMDGKRLNCITKAEIVVSATDLTQVTLSVLPLDGLSYKGEADVSVSPEQAQELVRLGWTPPTTS
jgi:hypothetical protein